jgi:hypothetical protein
VHSRRVVIAVIGDAGERQPLAQSWLMAAPANVNGLH